jgi:Ion channel
MMSLRKMLYVYFLLSDCVVGYGDVIPVTENGKVFVIFYVLVGCTIAGRAFGTLVRLPLIWRERATEMEVMNQFGSHLSEGTSQALYA